MIRPPLCKICQVAHWSTAPHAFTTMPKPVGLKPVPKRKTTPT